MLISRQVLICLFLQIACALLIFQPKALKKLILWGGIVLALFVMVGCLRLDIASLSEILDPSEALPEWSHPLLWIYAYLTTPFNNIHAAFYDIQPAFTFFHELMAIVPTIFKELFYQEYMTGFDLVHDQMMVSTFYYEPLLDFGPVWAFFFMLFFQLILLLSFRRAYRTYEIEDVLIYSVFWTIMILSVFSNLLLYLPVVAQVPLMVILKFLTKKKFRFLQV